MKFPTESFGFLKPRMNLPQADPGAFVSGSFRERRKEEEPMENGPLQITTAEALRSRFVSVKIWRSQNGRKTNGSRDLSVCTSNAPLTGKY